MANPEARFYITATDSTAAAFRSAAKNLDAMSRAARSTRNLFASFGVALSARALVQWVDDALELNKLTSQQAQLVGQAKQAWNALGTEVGDIVRQLATEAAPAITRVLTSIKENLFPTEIQRVRQELEAATQQLATYENAALSGFNTSQIEQQRQAVRALKLELQDLEFAAPIKGFDGLELFDLQAIRDLKLPEFWKGQKMTPELTAFTEQLREGAALTEQMRTETEKNLEAWQKYQDLFANGAIEPETFTRLRDSLLEPIEVTQKRLKELEPDTEQWARSIGQGMQSAFAGFLAGTETDFRSFLRRLAAEFATSQIFAALSAGIGGGGATSGVAKFFGKIFGGFKAEGGPVSAGKSYIVGERGPELFTPKTSGAITPNGGGAPINVTQHLHFDVGLESVDDRIRSAAGPISSATMGAIMKALNRPKMA